MRGLELNGTDNFMNKEIPARERIVAAATELFHKHGIHGVSVDTILAQAGAGKSQFAHYFKNKEGLISAVIVSLDQVIRKGLVESNYSLSSWRDFESWFERYIEFQRRVHCHLSCPLGTIGNGLTESQEELRRSVQSFFEWANSQLARFFTEKRAAGELPRSSNPNELASLCLAVMEGGMLLTRISRSTSFFEQSAKQVVQYVRLLRKSCHPKSSASSARY